MKKPNQPEHDNTILPRLTIIFCIAVIVLSGNGWADSAPDLNCTTRVPAEVQAIIDGYIRDSLGSFGFNAARELLHLDTSLHANDIGLGLPIEAFLLSPEKFALASDSVPVDSVLIPAAQWYVPVRAYGKYLYFFGITNYHGPWKIFWMCAGWAGEWQKVRAAQPEDSNNKPVVIINGSLNLLHFPKKGRYNITNFIGNTDENDTNRAKSSHSYKTLEDSRVIFKQIRQYNQKRQRLKGRG